MDPATKNKFGRVDLEVTAFGFGTAPVGNIFREIDEETSDGMFQAAWDSGVRYYDTAPMYGHGLAELRTGQSLRWKNRDDLVLSSKVGRRLVPAKRSDIDFAPWTNAAPFNLEFDYTYDGTMRAFEDSLQRLALERMDICFIHDIDIFTRGDAQPDVFKQAMDGAWKALAKLRDEGAKYNYAPAPAEIMDRVAKIEAVCADHQVPLPAAALQFVVAHPAIPSFIAGTRTIAQLDQNLNWFRHEIPADFWAELKHEGLLRIDAPVPV
ncbi:aldo/keto reductase [Roseobacter litoralis]|uniref:aldo/keto reductase n=1 Tax=Roseobacter litoralis TaxID=42443 RepID=UPI00249124E7|nr:aldo/keto reductase [Roseobacter litoralis]